MARQLQVVIGHIAQQVEHVGGNAELGGEVGAIEQGVFEAAEDGVEPLADRHHAFVFGAGQHHRVGQYEAFAAGFGVPFEVAKTEGVDQVRNFRFGQGPPFGPHKSIPHLGRKYLFAIVNATLVPM